MKHTFNVSSSNLFYSKHHSLFAKIIKKVKKNQFGFIHQAFKFVSIEPERPLKDTRKGGQKIY